MLHDTRDLRFRPSASPGILSPITVRSCGHYRFSIHREQNLPRGFTQIFWVVRGPLVCEIDDRSFTGSAGDVFYYGPTDPHCVSAGPTPIEYRWATFDGPLVGDWLAGAGLARQPRAVGPCPVDLFEQLSRTITLPDPQAESRGAELGLQLLLRFAGRVDSATHDQPTATDSPIERVRRLIDERFTDPEFGVDAVARAIGCHRSTVFRLFRARHGISPAEYLQRLRVGRALELLRSTRLPIADIAPACGFKDPNYFAKVIRRATGDAPTHVRHLRS